MENESALQEKVTNFRKRLEKERRKLKGLFLLRGIGEVITFLFLYFFGVFLLDYLVPDIPGLVRGLFLVGGLVGGGYLCWKRVIVPVKSPLDEYDLALAIEDTYPELQDRLVTALEFADDLDATSGSTRAFQKEAVEEGLAFFDRVDLRNVLTYDRVYEWLAKGGICLFFVALFVGAFPKESNIFVKRLLGQSVDWPKATHISLLDTEQNTTSSSIRRVVSGESLKLGVKVQKKSRRVPDRARLIIRYRDGKEQVETVGKTWNSSGQFSQFVYTVPSVRRDFSYVIEAGDDRTEVQQVQVLPRPKIEGELQVFYDYPEYVNREDTDSDKPVRTQKINAPYGTEVRVRAPLSNYRSSRSQMVSEDGKQLPENTILKGGTAFLKVSEQEQEQDTTLTTGEDGQLFLETVFRVRKNGVLYFQLQIPATKRESDGGASMKVRTRSFSVHTRADRAPFVKVNFPGEDEQVTPVAEYPVKIRAKDDYGIARDGMTLHVSFPEGDRSDRQIQLGSQYNDVALPAEEVHSTYTFSFSDIGVEKGDVIQYFVRVRDQGDSNEPSDSRSYRFEVVDAATLEKSLSDLQVSIRREVQKIRDQQQDLNQEVQSIMNKISASDDLRQNVRQRLTYRRNRQMTLQQRMKRTVNKLEDVYRSGTYNQLWNSKARTQLKNLFQKGEEIEEDQMDRPVKLLARALSQTTRQDRRQFLGQVQQSQKRILRALDTLLQDMKEWENFAGLVRAWKEVFDLQKKMIKQVQKEGN